jgi:hypothetical protein
MRLARFASLMALVLLAAGCAATQAKEKPRGPRGPEVVAGVEGDNPCWTVTAVGKTAQDADTVALNKAVRAVNEYLERQNPPIEWRPTPEWVNNNLVKSRVAPKEVDLEDPVLGKGFERTLKVEVGPHQRWEIREKDRGIRVRERQLVLARVLAGVVALLVAVVGYLRLDDATKGYYTLWLRLGTLGLLGGIGAALLLLG